MVEASRNHTEAHSANGGRPPISFQDEDLPNGRPNSYLLLVIRAFIANHNESEFGRASFKVISSNLFQTLRFSEKDLWPPNGGKLSGFDGSTTRTRGTLKVLITFREGEVRRTIKSNMLVIDAPSPFNCLIGQTTLTTMGAVSSKIHLKKRYHNREGKFVQSARTSRRQQTVV